MKGHVHSNLKETNFHSICDHILYKCEEGLSEFRRTSSQSFFETSLRRFGQRRKQGYIHCGDISETHEDKI